jgi:hypothetical protein
MKKTILISLATLAIILSTTFALRSQPAAKNLQNATYYINGEPVTLRDGVSDAPSAPNSASRTVTRYFGNEAYLDLNKDGRQDTAFLLIQETGGSGTFYYLAAALNTEHGYLGSKAVLLGDRIAPQSTSPSPKGRVIVNYSERKEGEAFSVAPSVGASVTFVFDPKNLEFSR